MKEVIKRIISTIIPRVVLDTVVQSPLVIRLRRNPSLRNVYYCKALNGDSTYNICINSDMTVSCNCLDYDGNGHIGDLNQQTLEQIFHGKTAQGFRRKLAKGWLPIPECSRCCELQRIDKKNSGQYLSDYHMPYLGIMVENTALCNLKCTHCSRDKVMKTRKKTSMSLEDMEKVAKIIRSHQIKSIFFLNLGEPFLSPNIFEEISIIRKYNPQVKVFTSTNGLLLDSEKKKEAALMMDHILFSIDGPSQELVARYQIGGDFERSYRNMKDLVALRNSRNAAVPIIDWKYVVFRWNDGEDAIERAIELSKEARIDIISFWRGEGHPSETSERFLHDPFFQRLGEKSWKGREIDLREYSYSLSMEEFEMWGDRGSIAKVLCQSAARYETQAKHKEAVEKYMQSLKILEELGHDQGIASVHRQIGRSYESDGDYKEALRKYASAYRLFEYLKSSYKDLVAKDIQRIKDKVGEETFKDCLAEILKS